MPRVWLVYVLVSHRAERTYVGIALDLARRLGQHNGQQPGGAKATRAFRPWRVGVVHGPFRSRSEAQSVERCVKKLRGRDRLDAPFPELGISRRVLRSRASAARTRQRRTKR